MVHKLSSSDFDSILLVINNAAKVYNGIIPKDRLQDPYMRTEQLRAEIESGVIFYG